MTATAAELPFAREQHQRLGQRKPAATVSAGQRLHVAKESSNCREHGRCEQWLATTRLNQMAHNRAMAYKVRKPDHNGAKNGGGHWGKRAEAKKESSRVRRQIAKKETAVELNAAPRK
jgi:hypothetical protein